MIHALSIVGIVSSLALHLWSSAVWKRCGYDCGIIDVGTGPAAVAASFGAMVLFIGSIAVLVQDIPEHYFFMTYELTESEEVTSLLVRQEDPRPSPPNESTGGDEGPDVLSC